RNDPGTAHRPPPHGGTSGAGLAGRVRAGGAPPAAGPRHAQPFSSPPAVGRVAARSPQQVPPAEVDERQLPDRRLDLVDKVVVKRESVGPVAGLDPHLVEAREGRDAGGGDPPCGGRRAGRRDPARADRGGDHVVPQQLGLVGHDSSSAAWRARRRRLRIRRRSFSAVPPQIPNLSEFSRAYSRHSTRTGQVAQPALAAATESLSPLRGKNRSGSTPTQAPSSIQPVSATTSTLITPPPSWRRAGGSRCRLEPLPEGVVDDAEPGGEAGDHGGLHTGGVE